MQEEERVEARYEDEQPTEETRKRRREAEEARAKKKEGKASDLILEFTYISWRDKLQHRDFIGERGFSKLISLFQESIEKRGWHLFCEHKTLGLVDVVKEFYANMVEMKDKAMCVRGKWISFSREQIDQTYNLNDRKNGS